MQRFTQDGVVYEEAGDGQVRVIGYADAPAPATSQGGVFALPQDPTKQAMGAAQLEKLRRDIAQSDQKFAERNVPNGYRLRPDGSGVEPIPGGPNDPSAVQPVNSPKLTAKERADAIAGFTSARHLDDKIKLIEQRFRAGPGATSGIGGLMDYLPTTANQQFDNAGKSARGFVKQALGFTGGENNTARESEFNIGPYIPQSSDRDATVLDKLSQLRDLSQQARERSIGILGGVPDANGKITPYAPPPQSQMPVFDPGQGFRTVATGATKSVRDDSKSAQVAALQSLLRSGAPDDQIRAVAAGLNASSGSVDAALAFRRKNPGYKGAYNLGDLSTRQEATTARERISGSGFGAFTANALNDAAAGIPGAAFGTDNLRAQQAAFPSASNAGSLVGGIAGASGLELGLGAGAARLGGGALSRILASPITADAVYGGVQGATTAGTPTGAVIGAGAGIGGGMFGRGATRAAGRALRGVTDTGVRYLADSGVPLTVGQTLGGVAKGIEDRLSGVPIVGDAIRSRRLEGLREFNRTAFDQGLSNIGASTGGTIGEEGIDLARGATRQGYRRALDGVSVARDPQFTGEYNAALAQGARVPRVGPEFEAWAQAELDPLVAQRQYTGPIVQDFLQQTRDADFGTDAMGNLVGRSVQGAEDAMRSLVSRQAPDVLPALQRADQAYRQTQVLRDAVNRARNGSRSGETGTFTPSQLSDAAAANARQFGNTAGTTQQPFFELSRAGQAVLPSQVPDSGTAGRLATLALPGLLGAGGAGAGYAGGDTSTGAYTGLGVGAALTAGGTRAAQRLATRALLDRPDAFIRIGNRVYNRAQIGGMFGAGLGASGTSLLASDF